MNSTSKAKTIFVLEDEPAISEMCQRVLGSEGYEVDSAVSSKVAEDMIAKKDYNLCLIDIKTPGLSGEKLYRWLQEKHPHLAERVVFTTGGVTGEETKSFLEQAAKPFLRKPFTPEELRAIISETLEKR